MQDDWFKTGNIGHKADDELYKSGRKKDLIIVDGKNVYPPDIEKAAMEVEGVNPGRVVAFGLFNVIKGTEDVVLIAEIENDQFENKEPIAAQIRQKITQSTDVILRNVHPVKEK